MDTLHVEAKLIGGKFKVGDIVFVNQSTDRPHAEDQGRYFGTRWKVEKESGAGYVICICINRSTSTEETFFPDRITLAERF